MKQNNKVSGNTLVVTVIITLILAILCTSVILLAYYNKQQQLSGYIEHRLLRNLESATNLVLTDTGLPAAIPHPDTLDLFDEQQDSVIIRKENWGIFQVTSIVAFSNRFLKKRSFIVGSELSAYMDGCLYMADHKRPLLVSGNTSLTGDIYISKAGISASYINQRGYSSDKLVTGRIKTSRENLPPVNRAVIAYLYQLENTLPDRDMLNILSELPRDDSMVQSFYDSAICLYSKNSLQLHGLTLKGHIIVKSDSSIEAGAATYPEDIILVAPVIKFAKGFKGTVQAIATDSIIVEENCAFEYPSALVLLKKQGIKPQNIIKIGEGCRLNGVILTNCDSTDTYKTYVEIKKSTEVNGIVYVMGYLSLEAKVHGTVLTDFFIYKKPGMVYDNHLVDVEINRRKLSSYFIGAPVFESTSPKQIVKWVQ